MGFNKLNTNFLFGHSVRKNRTTFSDDSLLPQIFHCNDIETRQWPVLHLLLNWIFWKLGRFPFNQNFQKEDNLATYTQIFRKIPFNFAPGIFGWMVRISKIQQVPELVSGNFSEKFLYHLPLFPNFRKFWLNGKRSMLLTLILYLRKLSSICTSNYLWSITKRAGIHMNPSDTKSNTLVQSKRGTALVTNSRLAVIGFGVTPFWLWMKSRQPFCRLYVFIRMCGETQITRTSSFRHVTKL